jgi:uncharacterized protein
MTDKKCILLFIKSPEMGTVKSRLAKDIHEDAVLALYKHFVLDILKTVETCGHSLIIYFYPSGAKDVVSAWLGERYTYMPQVGKDLGQRMEHAFRNTFTAGFEKVIIIGSDVPDLTCSLLNESFVFDHCDTVLGPSHDGGYYLIGLKRNKFAPEIFKGIPWGTERVLGDTMDVFQKIKYTVHLLHSKRDIDRIEDLRAFFKQNENTGFSGSGTMQFIRDNFETLFGEKKIS